MKNQNKKILTGSCAILHYFPDFPRIPTDRDYIVKEIPEYTPSSVKVEYLLNPVFDDYELDILLPDDLYTLKLSHAVGWDVKWEKHVFDIQFLKSKSCRLNLELFYKLYEYWNDVHGKNRRSDLEMNADEFFDNAVKYPIEHDVMHTWFNNPPTYTKILTEGEEVLPNEEKFNSLSHEEKCALVREECYVMSVERYSHLDYRTAFSKMLKKFTLNHAPLWEAIFILENYVELHKAPFNYLKFANEKLKEYGNQHQ